MKNISIIVALFALIFTTVSCETYDDYETERDAVLGFTQTNVSIKVPNEGTREKNVNVFISESVNVDRTFNIVVIANETQLAPENYSIPSSVTILANEREAGFVITGIDVSLTDEKLPLVIEIQGESGVVLGANRVTAVIFK